MGSCPGHLVPAGTTAALIGSTYSREGEPRDADPPEPIETPSTHGGRRHIGVPSGITQAAAFTLPRRGVFSLFVPSLSSTACRVAWATQSGGPSWQRGWAEGVDFVVGSTVGPGVGRFVAVSPWAVSKPGPP
jgi:hypothetical protein